MICQACGGEATERPALCPTCRAEREAHGRVKSAHRGATLASRRAKVRRGRGWSL